MIFLIDLMFAPSSTDLLNGTSDPDVVIPKMRGELEAAGIDELIADIQSEPDAHLAATKRQQQNKHGGAFSASPCFSVFI